METMERKAKMRMTKLFKRMNESGGKPHFLGNSGQDFLREVGTFVLNKNKIY